MSLPPNAFDRVDEKPDVLFYDTPRLVTHIDASTIAALSSYYSENLSPNSDVLDWMSSWVSHLPEDLPLDRVAGLGMNAEELAANPRLSEFVVHDLNETPKLPFEDASFDVALNAVSVQYLRRPLEVFSEIGRVLRPGGCSIVAMSHRCFPTKAIRAFHVPGAEERFRLVSHYHEQADAFDAPTCIDRSPSPAEGTADPLWIVMAKKRA